jgi:hypothetical protein
MATEVLCSYVYSLENDDCTLSSHYRSIASFSELKERENALRSAADKDSVHPIIEITLSMLEEYRPYHESRIKLDLMNRFYGVDDTNNEALETMYDVMDQVNCLVHTGGIADSTESRSTDNVYEALVSLKSGMCVLLKSVDEDSTLTDAVASKNATSLEEKWKSFCELMCTHPYMGSAVRNGVDPVGRALQMIDSTLRRGPLVALLTESDTTPPAAPYSIFPPLPYAGDGAACHIQREGGCLQSILSAFLVGKDNQTRTATTSPTGTAVIAGGICTDTAGLNATLRAGVVLGVVAGPIGCGKSSLALSATHAMHNTQPLSPSESENSNGVRYNFVRWMQGTGCMDELYTEWVRLACLLGVYEHILQHDIVSHIDATFKPPVSLPDLVQRVYAAIASMNYLLVFDGVSNYESIASFLPPRDHGVSDSGQESPAHHILITTSSPSVEWNAANPDVAIDMNNFRESESVDFVMRRAMNDPNYVEEEMELAVLKGWARAIHGVTDGNPLALSLAISAIEMCSTSSGADSVGGGSDVGEDAVTVMSVTRDYLGRVRQERGEDVAGPTSTDAAASSACCLPFFGRKKKSPGRPSEASMASPAGKRQGQYQLVTASSGVTGESRIMAAPSVSIAIRMMSDKLSDESCFPSVARKLIGFLGFMNCVGIPRSLMEELTGSYAKGVALAGLKHLEDAMIIRSENDSSSRYAMHPLVQTCFCVVIAGVECASQAKVVLTRFSLSSLLDKWIEPLVLAWNKLYVSNSHRHDRLVKWGNHMLVLVRFLDRLDLSQQHDASDGNLAADNYGVVPEMVHLLALRRRVYLLLAKSCGAQGVHQKGV